MRLPERALNALAGAAADLTAIGSELSEMRRQTEPLMELPSLTSLRDMDRPEERRYLQKPCKTEVEPAGLEPATSCLQSTSRGGNREHGRPSEDTKYLHTGLAAESADVRGDVS